MDLLIEKLDGSRYYLSQYKVLITDFEESAPSVTRNSKQLDQRNGNIDFGGWHTDKTINITGYYRADDMDEEETLREKLYALLSDPDGYYITQIKTTPSMAMERPGETSGGYYDKLNNYPSHKRFLVYTEAPEMELVGNVGGTLLYKLTAEFKTIKLPYGESMPQDLDVKPNVPYYGDNLLLDSQAQTRKPSWFTPNSAWTNDWGTYLGSNIYRTSLAWDNARYSYKDLLDRDVINTTDDFTYSVYFRVVGEDPAEMSYANIKFISSSTTKNGSIPLQLTSLKDGQWARIVVPFKFIDAEYDPTKDYENSIRVEMSEAPKLAGAHYEFAASKLEKGSVATPYTLAPEDPYYNKWYFDTYYNTKNLAIPYAGTVLCNQLEQGFAIEMTAKAEASSLSFKIDDTELTYSGAVASGDVFMFNGFSYTQNKLSIVSKTNKAYFILRPDKPNRITCNVPGTVRIIGLQNLYA